MRGPVVGSQDAVGPGEVGTEVLPPPPALVAQHPSGARIPVEDPVPAVSVGAAVGRATRSVPLHKPSMTRTLPSTNDINDIDER